MSRFCTSGLKVYEWDGSEFQNLFADDLYFFTGTEHGDCLPITFPPDPNGGKMVQTGITYNTVCPDEPYQKIITFQWNGTSFREKPESTSKPPAANAPSRCTIEWAMDAGRENDTAVVLLENALTNWPLEAEQEWGPAARDFLRFYLATWYIERDQIEQGLTFLTEIRDKPFTPEYPLPSKLAKIFLNAYQTMGLYGAVNEVEEQYSDEQPCNYEGCHAENMRETWGYFEHDWEYEYPKYLFTEDFTRIGSLNRVLQQERPSSLNELNQILDRNKHHPVWSVQGDMDGQGEEDWLLTVKDERGEDGCPIFKFYAYLQNETGSDLVYLYMLDYSIGSGYCGNVIDFEPSQWNSFSSDTNTGPINVLETPYQISSFRFVKEDGKTEIKEVLSLSKKLYWVDDDPGLLIHDWSVDNGRLLVEYTDRQVTYIWSADEGKLIPTGSASELQEENIARSEQAIYINNQPTQAVTILNEMLKVRIWENSDGRYGRDDDPPWIRPYALYLLGLAYEQSGDSDNAVRAYWQLWHEYPTNPYSIAAQSKLERK